MRKLIIPIYFMLIALIGMSCEKIIDITIPDSERKIVVNGLISPDSMVHVNISRSLSVLEDNEFVFLDKATVELFESGSSVGILKSDGKGFYDLPGFLPSANKTYELKVESEGLQGVSATTSLPPSIAISTVDTSSVATDWGSEDLKFSFTLSDPPEENYYAIAMYATHKVFDYQAGEPTDSMVTYPINFQFISNGQGGIQDMLIDQQGSIYFNNKIFMSDQLFNAKDFKVDLSVGKYFFFESDTVWLDLQMEHVSKPYYLYASSMYKYRQSDGNPFAEPVSVYTNVKNGLGVFSAYTPYKQRFELVGNIEWE